MCKTRDRFIAEYALRDINKPIGISEYRLAESLPEKLKGSLPTIEELESEMGAPQQRSPIEYVGRRNRDPIHPCKALLTFTRRRLASCGVSGPLVRNGQLPVKLATSLGILPTTPYLGSLIALSRKGPFAIR
jgi:hypothetical protein